MDLRSVCVTAFLLTVGLVPGHVGGRSLSRPRACPTLRLQNGMVKLRSKGRVARFICSNGFKPFGDKTATCVGGRWEGSPPLCVRPGCLRMAPPKNGVMIPYMGGAVQSFFCSSGYRLSGATLTYCNGLRWNGTVPTCEIENTTPELSCDFETEGLCGWSQNPENTIDWTRHRFSTPSGHVGTGPSHDHTRGAGQDGYYMYIESSGRRALNDTARLFSPVYLPETSEDACFIFWYHMYGATIGTLSVYQKLEGSSVNELSPLFSKQGDQGNLWFRGLVRLNTTDKPFQVVVEGVPGRGYLGDAAIDDVLVTNGSDCQEPIQDITATVEEESGGGVRLYDDAQSCRHRCTSAPSPPDPTPDTPSAEIPVMVTCDCHVGCMENGTCCPDYSSYCILAKVTSRPVIPTLEYRTIATVHYVSIFPPRPTLPKPPPLPPLPPKPTDMTSSNVTDPSTNLTTRKVNTSKMPTSLEVELPSSVLPTEKPQVEVTSTKLVTNLDEVNIASTRFLDSIWSTVKGFDTSQVSVADETMPSTQMQEMSSSDNSVSISIGVGLTEVLTDTITPSTLPPFISQLTTGQEPTTREVEMVPSTIVQFDTDRISQGQDKTEQTESSVDEKTKMMIGIRTPPTRPPTTTPTTPPTTSTAKLTTTTPTRPTTTTSTKPTKPTTTKKSYFPGKKPFFPKKTTTTKAPTTQSGTPKTTTKDKLMLYPRKDAVTNYLLKKELDPRKISGKLWQQPHKAAQEPNTSSASKTIGIVGGVALLLVALGVVAVAVVRRRRVSTHGGRDLSDDSDVRFLTADEVLDFNLAKVTEEDDRC